MQLAVSVDLDETRHYRAIHGLSPGSDNLVYARAISRLSEWARQRGVPVTWFAVGSDLEVPANAEAVRGLVRLGDEVASHSFSHHYDLTQRPAAEISEEIERGVQIIETVTKQKVSGFRAPGYVVNDVLLELLREQGLSYDASVFPCPSYYALKAAAVVGLKTSRRPSSAVIDTPEVLRAPTRPYRVGRPYWYRGSGIWEVPVQVTRGARLPFIGTSLTLGGTVGARLLARGVLGEPLVNLELHGLDALDERDGLGELAKRQRDLRIPWSKKLDAIDAAVSVLRQHRYGCVRMDELVAYARASA